MSSSTTASELAAELREGIAAGQYRYGTRLPGVRGLAEQRGVSQQTVAAAYATLAALGLVRTERGSGTVVTAGRAATAHLGAFSPPNLAVGKPWRADDGEVSEETTLVRQLPAPKYVQDWGISGEIVERTRIRRVDGVPVQHKLTVMPYQVAARVPDGHQGVPPMLAPVGAPPLSPPAGVRVADWLGWDVGDTEVRISAEPMLSAAAEALGVSEAAPGFRILNITRDGSGGTLYATVTTAPLHHTVTMDIHG
ncbi:GntR family transcriptional regulator [Streptomyces sp. NPDC059152]|uniref:GntR family transcriptional regulator n=1 Tax=Streptomyces sp. NPDC059152 TaxID=3346742 RepID=UPI0036A272E5